MSVSYGGDSIVFADGSVNASGFIGHRNRIINGAMVVDQRNAGAAVTVNAEALFFASDRFRAVGQASPGVYTLQRVTDAPAGFVNSAKVTVTTADASLSASDRYFYQQVIEGNNVADLNFGLNTAQTITVSFWVKSSLTGSFGGSLYNNAGTRSYPYSYTISVANTWEYKTITIAGDTTGTWPTDNTGWGRLTWSFGSGSTFSSTANSWQAGQFEGVTGQVQLISTLSATWQITGVQLERGSTASSFEYRSFGTELALCQRYLPAFTAQSGTVGPLPGNGTALGTNCVLIFNHPVPARVPGTGLGYSAATHFNFSNNDGNSPSTAVSFAAGSPSATQVSITVATSRGATTTPGWFYANNTAATLYITGCEL